MNILTDTLPTSLEIGGKRYRINSDFRACIDTMRAFEDSELTPEEKQKVMLLNLYRRMPPDGNEAARQAAWFLDGGREREEKDGPRLFSFDKDAPLIFAAFRQTHNIDLQKVNLHWWVFLALFMDMGADTTFCSLTGLRKRDAEGKTTKEEKQMIRSMGEIFYVPDIDDRTIEEREAERAFMELVEVGERARRQNECQTQP